MPSEFRFLLICLGATQRLEDGLVTLSGVVNTLVVAAAEVVELAAVLGLILRPEMSGKRLDLMAWKLDAHGKRTPIPGYAGTPLILPRGLGPHVLPYSVVPRIPPKWTPGVYGFELFDRDAVFGPQETLLATYMFGVVRRDDCGTDGMIEER